MIVCVAVLSVTGLKEANHMALTGKQAHVLANLDRVVKRPYKVHTPSQRDRFDLDGWDCTPQISSLIVRKQVKRTHVGSLVRSLEQQ
jgi:hypothetical protein